MNQVINLYQKAIDTLNASHSRYRQALDIHGDNKDQVKLKGKENITNNIAIIEKYLALAKEQKKKWQDVKKEMRSRSSSTGDAKKKSSAKAN
ncbi:MAG: hypothetical protein ACK5Y2_07245 [Bdellovibrionales bacterium]